MNWIIPIISITLLGILAFQDFRSRAISWYLLPLLLLAFFFSGSRYYSLSQLGLYFGVNLSFILLQLALLTVYFSLKHRRFTNIIDRYIGLGDILFFPVICAAFSPVNFILFYVFCLCISLLWVVFKNLFFRSTTQEIPLAGIFSVALILILCWVNSSTPNSLYSEELVLAFAPLGRG